MSYAVKEIFLTLQGEGGQAGRAAVFCRFAGCNLWSGREADRAGAVCTFCDTDFVGMDGEGGGRFDTAQALADAIAAKWRGETGQPALVVCTGGEPLLQLDEALIAALHARGFEVAVIPETVKRTTLGEKSTGATINLETDILIKAVARQLQLNTKPAVSDEHLMEHLRRSGFEI